jgi:hypothetical protein
MAAAHGDTPLLRFLHVVLDLDAMTPLTGDT